MTDLVDLDERETLLVLGAVREARLAAEARELEVLAHYADLCSDVEQAGRTPNEVLHGERLLPLGDDGTPEVAEFAALEIAALWNEAIGTVNARIGKALTLRHRFPQVWELMGEGLLARWVAEKIADKARDLPVHAALVVDARVAEVIPGVPNGRLLAAVEGWVLELTPKEIVDERRAAEQRGVWVRHDRQEGAATGASTLFARLSAPAAQELELQVRRLAQMLKQGGHTGELDERRADALGVLATPARALQLMQASILDELPAELDELGECPLAGRPGHLCGQITVDPEKLLPRAELVLHVTDDALAQTVLTAAARPVRTEGCGPLLTSWLPALFGHHRITVKPVLDVAATPPVDSYEIPRPMRQAVLWRHPFDMFPGSGIRSLRCDADHIVAWRESGDCDIGDDISPPLTRVDNLAPLSRTAHRAKTFAGWHETAVCPGVVVWRSPLGFVYLVTPGQSLLVARPRSAQTVVAAA